MRRVVVGLDGSPGSRRAAALVARLQPPRGGQVTCVRVIEPVRAPAMPLVPRAVRARLAAEADALTRERAAAARRQVEPAVAALARTGWSAKAVVRAGVPLDELLAAVREARADVLVVGARGEGGAARVLLGGVAHGALKRAPCAVLTVK